MDPAPRIPEKLFSSRDTIVRNGSRDKVGTVLGWAGVRVFMVVDWIVSWTEGAVVVAGVLPLNRAAGRTRGGFSGWGW
jgi:hypothetical protein